MKITRFVAALGVALALAGFGLDPATAGSYYSTSGAPSSGGGGVTTKALAGTEQIPVGSPTCAVGFQCWTTPTDLAASGSATITAGTTPTSGVTSGNFISSSSNLAQDSGKSVPTGAVVGTSDTQTLTNKSIAASEVNSGTLAATQMPALTGDCTTSAGAVATTCTKTSGVAFGALATATPGANVAAATAVALSAAGGLTSTLQTGTAALGTSLITSGACGSATTVSATGVATTDVITVGFNGDPTAVTGYTPTAMLTILAYPTANNVNLKQCNQTASSITPSALTVNWKVVR